jgi:anaerobic selenocysteine-containing dehydrogenase
MLAVQLIASHTAAMESYRRAMLAEQTFEGRQAALSQAGGKGQQKVTVEHVHVHAGGQAIVGNVGTPGGGVRPKSEDQPHEKQVTHAPQPEVRSAREVEGQAMSIRRDEERPLPDARGKIAGSAEGE